MHSTPDTASTPVADVLTVRSAVEIHRALTQVDSDYDRGTLDVVTMFRDTYGPWMEIEIAEGISLLQVDNIDTAARTWLATDGLLEEDRPEQHDALAALFAAYYESIDRENP